MAFCDIQAVAMDDWILMRQVSPGVEDSNNGAHILCSADG